MLHFGILIYLLFAIVICLVIFLYRIKRLEQRVFKPPHLKPYKTYVDSDEIHIVIDGKKMCEMCVPKKNRDPEVDDDDLHIRP